MWVSVLGGERLGGIILVLSFELLQSKGKGNAMSVSSCSSVNSAIMYNMEIMIKM